MLEAATPQIGHAWKEEIRQVLVEDVPDSKTPNKPIAGSLNYALHLSGDALSAAACKLLRDSGVPMRDHDNHRSGQASGTLTWYFDANNFKASFVWQP